MAMQYSTYRNEAGVGVGAAYELLYFIKYKNDIHVLAALQKLAEGCLVSELLKLKFRAHIFYLIDILKVAT